MNKLIGNFIQSNARVLDLGCGDGSLLAFLKKNNQVKGLGLEIDHKKIQECLQKDVSVIDQDIDSGLSNFQDQSFDAVIMSQSIQALRKPEVALEEITRIGKEAIISIPNFANWRCRLQLIFGGTMPISSALPHDWYSTPNIHLCSLKDFERLCVDHGADILDRRLLSFNGEERSFMKAAPNLLTEIALYRFKPR
ncbi:MAG: methionine biosynthesis protein MetW, partial [Gammaproteobacteria bacterium]